MTQFTSFVADSKKTFLTIGSPGLTVLPENELPGFISGWRGKKKEGFYSLFSFHGKPESFKGIKAIVHKLSLDCLTIDFDHKDPDGTPRPEVALADAKKFIEKFNLKEGEYALFFTGEKGYHLYIHASRFGGLLDPGLDLNERCLKFAQALSPEFPTIDLSIFDLPRKFRIPYSVHDKTKVVKDLVGGSWPLALGETHTELYRAFIGAQMQETTPREREYSGAEDGPVIKEFHALRNKPCVEKMLGEKFPGSRHNKLLMLTFDLAQSGHTDSEIRAKLKPFLALNPSEDNDREIESHLKDYRSGTIRLTGCKRKERNEHCATYCPVFSKLAKETKDAMPLDVYKHEPPKDWKPEYKAGYEEPGALALGSGKESKKKIKAPAAETPGELRIVHSILNRYGEKIVKQNKDIFIFDGTRWKHYDQIIANDYFKKQIDAASYGKLKYKDITSAYNRLLMHVPNVPEDVDMFTPNPHRMNFKNGCLHLDRQQDGTYSLALKPHDKEDYLTLCHPFDYQEDAPLNQEFEESLNRIWEGDPDIEQKKLCYFEVLGASLVPTFRKIVLFVGPAKTGKSTLIQFATSLVHKELSCSVDPSKMDGFNMHSMAGKLLNYDTDISLSQSLSDSVLKKVEDMIPVRIARKNMSDIYAPIPPIHLFGANKLPQSKDGAEVYDRRMIMIRCTNVVKGDATTGRHTQDYAGLVWHRGEAGILARAIEGLKRLCANGGHFTEPESSREVKRQWVAGDKDIVQLFIEWLEENPKQDVRDPDQNTQAIRDFSDWVPRAVVGGIFKMFMEQEQYLPHTERKITGRNKLFARLLDLGTETRRVKGVHEMKIRGQFLKVPPTDSETTTQPSVPSF